MTRSEGHVRPVSTAWRGERFPLLSNSVTARINR